MPEQPYLFISHSSQDGEFTSFLAHKLTEAGFACWVDVEAIPPGSTWPREIEKGVTGCAALIVVMTAQGRASEWVEKETLLALGLRKPVYIAKVDDTPLPIHLINIQYSDFRKNRETGVKKLIAALKKANLSAPTAPPPPTTPPKPLSPTPNEHNFFKYLEQLPDGEANARIARALYAWGEQHASGIHFSGSDNPAFHVNAWVGAGGVTVFSVRAYRRQPALEVPLTRLKSFAPYHNSITRRAVLKALDELAPGTISDDRADHRPSIPLIALEAPGALDRFTALAADIIDRLKCPPSTD